MLRLALLGDLHDRPGRRVAETVAAQRPDWIVITGDILEIPMLSRLPKEYDRFEYGANVSRAGLILNRLMDRMDMLLHFGRAAAPHDNRNGFAFLDSLLAIAPVYYSMGNHERNLPPETLGRLESSGVTVLDNRFVTVPSPIGPVEIGGLSTRFDSAFLDGFAPPGSAGTPRSQDGPRFRLLLCHHPEYYRWLGLDGRDIDLVLSGHAHGGQWRIGKRGVFAPGQGLFPKLTSGPYFGGRLIVTPGLSNTAGFPRLGNPTQVVMVEIAG